MQQGVQHVGCTTAACLVRAGVIFRCHQVDRVHYFLKSFFKDFIASCTYSVWYQCIFNCGQQFYCGQIVRSIQQIRPVSVLQLYFGLHLRHRSDSIAPERTKDSNLTSTGKRTVSIFGVGVLRCAIPRCSKQVGFVDSRCCDVGCWSARPGPTHSTLMFLTQPPTISLTEETSSQCSPLVSVQWNAHSSGTL
jgi:hypothetical protein